MRTCVLAPAANVNDVAEVMANDEVSLETMLLMVIDEPVVFLASTLSVLLADTRTSRNDRDEGASARPTVRWLTSALLKTTGVGPPRVHGLSPTRPQTVGVGGGGHDGAARQRAPLDPADAGRQQFGTTVP
jgi:hypothetical protein